LLDLLASGHPGLKLAWLHHHVFDVVRPSAAFLSIENDISYCRLAFVGLIRSLEGDRFDKVVMLYQVVGLTGAIVGT